MNDEPCRENQGILKVCAALVDLNALRQVLSDPRLIWVYAERMADTGLGTVADLLDGRPLGAPMHDDRPGVALERWRHGRAFGPELEVDWWREGDIFRLRVLAEGELPEHVQWADPGIRPALVAVGGPRSTLLYGTLDKDPPPGRPTWSEARIPRHLAYPVTGQGAPLPRRVALVGQQYARQGVVVLTRLVGVEPS